MVFLFIRMCAIGSIETGSSTAHAYKLQNAIKINGFLHALYLECRLKKWRFGKVDIFENEDIVELRTRKWSRFVCK